MGIPFFIFNIRLKTKTSCQSTKQIINQQKYVSKKIVFCDLVISQNSVRWKYVKDGQNNFLHLLVIITCSVDKSRIWLFWILSWKTTWTRITVQVSKKCCSWHLCLVHVIWIEGRMLKLLLNVEYLLLLLSFF